jgi:hypothetical protein
MPKRSPRLLAGAALFLCTALLSGQDSPASSAPQAQGAPPAAATVNETEALAKATQNPVASLISVPLQNNANFGVGPCNRTQDIFNIQPVIPKRISENWMFSARSS